MVTEPGERPHDEASVPIFGDIPVTSLEAWRNQYAAFSEQHLAAADPALPDWQQHIVEAFIRGDHIFIMPARRAGFDHMMRQVRSSVRAAQEVVIVNDPPTDRASNPEEQDRLMAWWFSLVESRRRRPTLDYDPARDRAALHQAEAAGPQEGDDTGPGLSIDELIPEIDEVLDGWRTERGTR